jgi:uncharacterized membrane protein YedE/YeeE
MNGLNLTPYMPALLGGVLIGIAVSLLLFVNGRVAGVSGILGGALQKRDRDFPWRLAFLLGLLAGGIVLQILAPEAFVNTTNRGWIVLVTAGLLVGYGTSLGSGCTSGHGICGLSRFSPRSLAATLAFMFFGILTATIFRLIAGA